MQAVRTPDDRFADLPDFPWQPRYRDDLPAAQGCRLAFLDEGPDDARHVFLCLHGEPSWSFLYRKMIPVFLAAGGRVVAPDFLGFGRSDKPVDDDAYSFDLHRDCIVQLIEALDLQRITLVCQDWGGLVGLTLPPDMPQRFERLLIMNTALGTGSGSPGKGFDAWQAFVAQHPDLDIGALMKRSAPGLSPAEVAAYRAPFPDVRFKAGVRSFPLLVPIAPDMPGAARSRAAARWWRDQWSGPTFMAIGMQDPVLGPAVMARMQQLIAGCPPPLELHDAGHFVQEQGDVVARAALEAWGGA